MPTSAQWRGKTINYTKFPNLTPSKVSALHCHKQFNEVHILKTVEPEGFARPLAYGSAVHETLKDVFNPEYSASPMPRNVKGAAIKAITRQGYPNTAERDEDTAKCIATVEAYVAQSAPEEVTLGVEMFENAKVGQNGITVTLGAKFDRLLFSQTTPDTLVIRDYKTGKPTETDLEGAAIMLAIAALRYKKQDSPRRFEHFAVEYDFLSEKGLVERRTVTFAEAKMVWADLKSRALCVYHATEFPAEPGEHCAFCPIRKQCRPDLFAEMDEVDALFS